MALIKSKVGVQGLFYSLPVSTFRDTYIFINVKEKPKKA
jgi:hypothetical protein